MTRQERLMPNGTPKYVRVYDNGGKSIDRYTVVYTGRWKGKTGCGFPFIGMSATPTHPQGFGQHGWSQNAIDRPAYKHLGKKIMFNDLPDECKKVVIDDYKYLWEL